MADRDMIEVKGLRVVAGAAPGPVTEIVKGVDFSVKKGEVLALIGESGSGKTTIALSLLGYARTGCAISGGSVRIGDVRGAVARCQRTACVARADRGVCRAERVGRFQSGAHDHGSGHRARACCIT